MHAAPADGPLGYAHEDPVRARDGEQVTASRDLPMPRPGPLLYQSASHAPLGQASTERQHPELAALARLWASP